MNEKLQFNAILRALIKLFYLNGIFLLLMSLYRLFFFSYFANLSDFKGLYSYLIKAFILGMRYDLAIIAYINLPVTLTIIIILILNRKAYFKNLLKPITYYYSTMYSLVSILLITDFGFFLYFKNHINILIFGIIEDDTGALISTIYENYPIIKAVIGFSVFVVLIYFICKYVISLIESDTKEIKPYSVFVKTGFALFLVTANVLAARGSLGLFPLGVMDAEISPNSFINKLAITGIHTFQQAIEFRMKETKDYNLTKEMGYENNIEQAFMDFLDVDASRLNGKEIGLSLVRKTRKNILLQDAKPNVIVIMMEGFGADLMKYNSEEFDVLGDLKKHFASDYFFPNFLSGDVGTIGSIESVCFNIPKRPQSKPLTQSKYAYNDYAFAGAKPYKKAGYETIFMYGGNANWRNMLSIMPKVGFDFIEGQGSMKPEYLKNQWGVYDEFLFDHIYERISVKNGKPKFIFVMTTSNHPPYSLPPTYKKLPLNISEALNDRITGNKDLAKMRFQTYQYSNQRLAEFITRIKNSEFAENTIIAVTGDHNFWDVFDYKTEELIDLYSVPFYIYIPKKLKPETSDTGTFGCHIDILPTLYNLSLSDAKYISIGTNLFDLSIPHIAFNVDGLIMSSDAVATYSSINKSTSYYRLNDNRKLSPSNQTDKHNMILKHYKSALAVTEYLIKNPFDIK
ncbi:MAG: sulfatase-like hydrolase/transferase [Endomicrobiales bacterium]|nr:sulfatase-like hydrolase/transferase [Endomicrobiales bacterium]